jgi:uncharacterized membrane protein
MSGFALLTVSYLWNAGTYLVDRAGRLVARRGGGGGAGLPGRVLARLRRHLPRVRPRKNGDAWVGALAAVLVCAAPGWPASCSPAAPPSCSPGAMIATAMSANVAMWIIPGQRKMVASIKAGQPVDPIHGQRGKQRSVHNTYFTLPVLVAMLSNHYSFLWSHKLNWLVLILMMAAGAAIRQFFVLRHGWKLGRNKNPLPAMRWRAWPSSSPPPCGSRRRRNAPPRRGAQGDRLRAGQAHPRAALLPVPRRAGADEERAPRFARGPEAARANVYQQAVVAKLMPMNNATGITDAERA